MIVEKYERIGVEIKDEGRSTLKSGSMSSSISLPVRVRTLYVGLKVSYLLLAEENYSAIDCLRGERSSKGGCKR